jgi:hypothetical protein
LLFTKGGSRDMVSPHDGDGELHLAFAIAADELTSWEAWLTETESLWKRREPGSSVVTAFISGIQTGTSSRLLHRESGQFIDAVAPFRQSLARTEREAIPTARKVGFSATFDFSVANFLKTPFSGNYQLSNGAAAAWHNFICLKLSRMITTVQRTIAMTK